MSVKIRLARGGAKKSPYYRIVVANVRAPRDGDFLEKIGTYNPLLSHDSENRVTLKVDRVNYWLSQGAQPTERVVLFLEQAGIALPSSILKKHLIRQNSRVVKPSRKELKNKK
jgi:small subunit ribosomal protein S16